MSKNNSNKDSEAIPYNGLRDLWTSFQNYFYNELKDHKIFYITSQALIDQQVPATPKDPENFDNANQSKIVIARFTNALREAGLHMRQ
jgi:hypothetical protein